MSYVNLALNAIVTSFAALTGCITQCSVNDEDDEHVRQVIQDGEDGISKMTIPMIVVTPADADPTSCIEHAIARANARPSRIPVPKGGLTSAKRVRYVLQTVSDGMERVVVQERVEEALAEVCETLVAIEDEHLYQQEIIANTIAGIMESMLDNLDDSEENQDGNDPTAP